MTETASIPAAVKRSRSHLHKVALLVALVLLVGIVGTVSAFAYSYQDRFYPGVTVAGSNVGGMRFEEGKAKIAEKAAQYGKHAFKVVVPDVAKPVADSPNQYEQKELDAVGTDLGISFNVDEAVDEAWKAGRGSDLRARIVGLVRTLVLGYRGDLGYTVDRVAMRTFINTQVAPATGLPIPAKISIDGANVVVEAPKPGFSVDPDALETVLIKNLENASDGDVTYVKAPVNLTDSEVTRQAVAPIADTLDALGNAPLSFKVGTATLKPTRVQLLSWFSPTQDEKGKVSLTVSQEAVGAYLKSQSSVDSAKSLAPAVKALASMTQATPDALKNPVSANLVAAASKQAAAGDAFTPNMFEGKYVEIDLSSQRMYLVDSSSLVKSYVVSTGKWATPTPLGTFAIRGKSPRAYSRSFGLYMPYWQDFLNGEYGLHELPEWPNGYKEGQNHLGTPVSHGCVRLGVGDAKEVYNWTAIGTPVVIHT